MDLVGISSATFLFCTGEEWLVAGDPKLVSVPRELLGASDTEGRGSG